MTERCTRWMELSDQQLLGDELTELELDFIHAHELECVACGREAAVLRELRPSPLHVVPSEDEVRRLLVQAELPDRQAGPQEPVVATGRSLTWRALAVASLLAAAAVVLLFALRPGTETQANHGPGSASASAGAASPLPAFLSKVTEDTCGPLLEGILLCVTGGSEIGRVELHGPQRFVELKRGRAVASLDPQPRGTSFSIVTRGGEVKAVGTVFSVELAEAGPVVARVARGNVLVRVAPGGSEQALLAGQRLSLGAATASALPPHEAARDLELVARWSSLLEVPRAHAEPAVEATEPRKDATPGGGLEQQLSIRDQLNHARELRAKGLFSRAAAIYQSVHTASPRSESGRAALMALASLQLSSLNEPAAALRSFETYLASGGGPLRQQAEYGKIRALRRLGRTGEEREATQAFIRRYPKAPEARLLSERALGLDAE